MRQDTFFEKWGPDDKSNHAPFDRDLAALLAATRAEGRREGLREAMLLCDDADYDCDGLCAAMISRAIPAASSPRETPTPDAEVRREFNERFGGFGVVELSDDPPNGGEAVASPRDAQSPGTSAADVATASPSPEPAKGKKP